MSNDRAEEVHAMMSIVLGDAVTLTLTDREHTAATTCNGNDDVQW